MKSIPRIEHFIFTKALQKGLWIGAGVSLVLVLGGLLLPQGHGEAEGSHGSIWKPFLVSAWHNNVYFIGLALVGMLFVAIHYAAQSGWSSILRRIPEAMGAWIPWSAVMMLLVFALGRHDIMHWTHSALYVETLEDGSANPEFDAILYGKRAFLNTPFFLLRMGVFFLLWYGLYRVFRRRSLQEDLHGGDKAYYVRLRRISVAFIIVFAVTSSVAAWDWVMSIDSHWYSTMMGWYVFSSWWVGGLSFITYIVIILHERNYLKGLNPSHLHDLGKYIFGFSIFWAYLWFSQFVLIYYANIPEESVYFIERWEGQYAAYFYTNLLINFFFPFLFLMTRDSKRHALFLKIACPVLFFGHWLDFYLMIAPGTGHGGLGLVDIGFFLLFLSGFLFVFFRTLSKASLIPPKDPMLAESVHHHI